jgi:protease IV
MPMDALTRDFYEERRRKWRRAAFWRGFLVAAVIAIVISWASLGERLREGARQVARVDISGVIVEDREREDMLRRIAEQENVRAVILRVNSPGGTTVGSEALFAAVRDIAAVKPVVAVLGEVAASGGYIAALSADHIVARGNTLTGSIGVILEYPDLSGLLDRIGVGVETLRSSELKAEPSPFRPTNPAARAASEALVAESYDWFRGLVAERRGLGEPALGRVANGGVFTGRIALDHGLVDAIGGEAEARDWLESQVAGLGDLPVRDWKVEPDRSLVGRLVGSSGSSGGILGEISRFAGPKLYSLGP